MRGSLESTKKTVVKAGLFLALIAPLAGCASLTSRQDVTPTPIGGRDLSQHLTVLANRVSSEWSRFLALEAPPGSAAGVGAVKGPPKGMDAIPITMRRIGPAVPALKRIAHVMGYRFRIVGDPGGWNPAVSIRAQSEAAVDVIRDIGVQLSPRGGTYVDHARRIVELIYLNDEVNQSSSQPMVQHPDAYMPRQAHSHHQDTRANGENQSTRISRVNGENQSTLRESRVRETRRSHHKDSLDEPHPDPPPHVFSPPVDDGELP